MNKPGWANGAVPAGSTKGTSLGATLLRVAWLSVLLGLGVEVLLLLFAASSGLVPELGEIVAASVQKISWGVIVCTGLAIGTTPPSAKSLAFALGQEDGGGKRISALRPDKQPLAAHKH